MTRRTILSMFATALTMLALALTISVGSAAAQQNPNCCTYTLDFRPTIPIACFPITVETEWGPGIRRAFTAATPGIYIDMVPPPCPPAFPFNWARVLPGGPLVPLWGTGTYFLPWCGYVITYTVTLDANGCIYIILR
jgi:hypothetical protein